MDHVVAGTMTKNDILGEMAREVKCKDQRNFIPILSGEMHAERRNARNGGDADGLHQPQWWRNHIS